MDGSYQFDDVTPGNYYAAAYKEVNGSEELEFIEVQDIDETYYLPAEPAGFYADETGAPLRLAADTSVVDNIDIEMSMEAKKYDIAVHVFAPFSGADGEDIAGAEVILYGVNGVEVSRDETDGYGVSNFNDLYGGYYYAEVSAPGYHDTRTAVYPILEYDNYLGRINYGISLEVFTGESIDAVFDSTQLDAYGYILISIDADQENLNGESVVINSSSGQIGYMPIPLPEPPQLDFDNLTVFPEVQNAKEDSYIAGIKGLNPGDYRVGLASDAVEDRLDVKVDSNSFIFITPPTIIEP